jgi:hypothetical protein
MDPACPELSSIRALAAREGLRLLTEALCGRLRALAAGAHDCDSAGQLAHIYAAYADDLVPYEEHFAEHFAAPIDSAINMHTGELVTWISNSHPVDHYFTWNEEKDIVAELPKTTLALCADNKDGGGTHLAKGLFLGQPCWANIEYAYKESYEPIPPYTASVIQACKNRSPRVSYRNDLMRGFETA